jgi:hypothetical protein
MTFVPDELVRLDHLDRARAVISAGARLDAMLGGLPALKDRIRDEGPALCVRTHDLVTFPYPTKFGLEGAPYVPAPYVMMRNRLQLVQVRAHGRLINVLINPTDPDRSLAAPFFSRQIERYGEFIAKRLLSTRHGSVEQALARWGVAPEDIDYITFDHLHVQDVRGLLGTDEPEDASGAPTPAFLPNARLLVQVEELATFDRLHPLQAPWYVRDGLCGVPHDKIIALCGDYLIGPGLALVRTPGHTMGNHTPVIVTDRGVFTVSENGIAVDSYAPEHSRIPGLARHARAAGVSVILNANTRENSLDQYISMMLEKNLADPCPERPEFPQHFSSSELTRSALAPGLSPTYSHGHITHGQVHSSASRKGATSAA